MAGMSSGVASSMRTRGLGGRGAHLRGLFRLALEILHRLLNREPARLLIVDPIG